jgi:hypothetical protein
MPPPLLTVTLAFACARPGALAWMDVDPGPVAVKVKSTVSAFAGMITDGGTVTTPVLSEVSVTVSGDAVGAERFNEMLCVPPFGIVIDCGEKVMDPPTLTERVADVYAGAVAVMVTVPRLCPVI